MSQQSRKDAPQLVLDVLHRMARAVQWTILSFHAFMEHSEEPRNLVVKKFLVILPWFQFGNPQMGMSENGW